MDEKYWLKKQLSGFISLEEEGAPLVSVSEAAKNMTSCPQRLLDRRWGSGLVLLSAAGLPPTAPTALCRFIYLH